MKLVVQRVTKGEVTVEESVVGKIEKGLVVLLGVSENDTKEQADYLINKLCGLRIFSDENDKMNLSIKDVNGKMLIISQFTLIADINSGYRPSFSKAAKFEKANEMYKYFIEECKKRNIVVEHGEFGANMQVSLINDGPVTIILDK